MLFTIFMVLSGVCLALPFLIWVVFRFIDKQNPITKTSVRRTLLIGCISLLAIAIVFIALAFVYFGK